MVSASSSASGASNIQSRIYEFASSALINIFAFSYAAVCDLYCAGPSPKSKWKHLQLSHYIGITSQSQSQSQSHSHSHSHSHSQFHSHSHSQVQVDDEEEELDNLSFSTYCHANPCTDDLPSLLQHQAKSIPIPVDLVSCFHHLQLCFESEDKARTLLHNVSSLLKPGGYFFGIVPDSSTIWTKYQKNVEASLHKGGGTKSTALPNYIRSDNYVITFDVEEDKFPSFGKKYQLKFANEATFEAHCLVHFLSLIRLAREAGLEYIELQNLTEFYDDNRAQFVGMLSNYGPNLVDPRGKLLPRSFDILGLYSIFVFQKPDPDAAPPLVTPPLLADEEPSYDEDCWFIFIFHQLIELHYMTIYDMHFVIHTSLMEWMGEGYMQPGVNEEIRSQMETSMVTTTGAGAGAAAIIDVGEQDKGILGPGPADLRLP